MLALSHKPGLLPPPGQPGGEEVRFEGVTVSEDGTVSLQVAVVNLHCRRHDFRQLRLESLP